MDAKYIFQFIWSVISTSNFWTMTLRMTTPILFAALGSCIAKKSGVFNMSMDGLINSSAFVAVIGSCEAQFHVVVEICSHAQFFVLLVTPNVSGTLRDAYPILPPTVLVGLGRVGTRRTSRQQGRPCKKNKPPHTFTSADSHPSACTGTCSHDP